MPSTLIPAGRFWDLYFRNAFLTLERGGGTYAGLTYAEPERAHAPGGLLVRNMTRVSFEIGFGSLREYSYTNDQRFDLILKRPAGISEGYEAVIRETYPYRDPAPFGKKRMSELFTEIRSQLVHKASPLSLDAFERMALSMIENYTEAQNQPLAAVAWFLGERRQRSSSSALLSIVHNAAFSPFRRHLIHFTPVDTALSALWKVNDKASLQNLLELMRNTTDTGRRKLAPLFERLLSTDKLLSWERCGDDYFRPEFWDSILRTRRRFTPSDWDRFDADSLFWEIRYLACVRLPPDDVKSLRKLADDEVQTVRDAVRDR